MILELTYFTFDNQVYKQSYGTSIDSLLSPILADLVMQDLKSKVLNSFYFPFYYRYIDIIMAVPREQIDKVLHNFNNFHSRFQFILEIGGWRQTVFRIKVQFITRYKKNGKQPHKYDTKLGFHI